MTSFRIAWEIGAVAWAAEGLEGIASSTAQTGQMQRATWLIGAASQLRLRSGWSVDLELFGRSPEMVQALATALGEQIYADLVSAGGSASWQELHDVVLGVGHLPPA